MMSVHSVHLNLVNGKNSVTFLRNESEFFVDWKKYMIRRIYGKNRKHSTSCIFNLGIGNKSYENAEELELSLCKLVHPSTNLSFKISDYNLLKKNSKFNKINAIRTNELFSNNILYYDGLEDNDPHSTTENEENNLLKLHGVESVIHLDTTSKLIKKSRRRNKNRKKRNISESNSATETVVEITDTNNLNESHTSELPISHLLNVVGLSHTAENSKQDHSSNTPLSHPLPSFEDDHNSDTTVFQQHSETLTTVTDHLHAHDSLKSNQLLNRLGFTESKDLNEKVLETADMGNPLGRKFLGKSVVQWLVKGISALTKEMVDTEINGQETFEFKDGIELYQLCQSYLSKETMPRGMEERCQMAAQHYSTVWDNLQRELQSSLQSAQSAGHLNGDWKDSISWKLLKTLAKSDGHKLTARSRNGNSNEKKKVDDYSEFELSLIQKNVDTFVSKALELLKMEKDEVLSSSKNKTLPSSPSSTSPFSSLSSSSDSELTDEEENGFSDSESTKVSQENVLKNMIAVSSTTGLGGIHLVAFKPSLHQSLTLPLQSFSPGDLVMVKEEKKEKNARKEVIPSNHSHLLQGNVYSLGEDGTSIVLCLKARYGDPTFSRLFGKNLCIEKMNSMADETTYERNVESLELLKSKGLSTKSACKSIVIDLFKDNFIQSETRILSSSSPSPSSPSLHFSYPPHHSPSNINSEVHLSINSKTIATSTHSISPSHSTLNTSHTHIPSLSSPDNILSSFSSSNSLLDSSLPSSPSSLLPFSSKELDASQSAAIAASLNPKLPVVVIQGPPGTGKSTVITEIVVQSVHRGEKVLVSAQTNAAVDNLVEKLSDAGLRVVRVGNPVRLSPSVSSKSLDHQVNDMMHDFKNEMMRRRSDLKDDLRRLEREREREGKEKLKAGIRQMLKQLAKQYKQKEKETIETILDSAQVILCTTTGAGDPLFKNLSSFDLTVLDEAAQATEPASWGPILLSKRVILAGDTRQLAPVILSRDALRGGLGISMMERICTLPHVPVFMLTTQHRMNRVIADWTSKEIYGGLLSSSPLVADSTLCHLPNVQDNWLLKKAMVALDTRLPLGSLMVNCEEAMDVHGTGSYINEGEADIVLAYALMLIQSGMESSSIVIQSPYLAQVQLLKNKIDEKIELRGIEIASVDSFQGRETDAVIISMVRSNPMGMVGFLSDARRMNVAITRARRHVAIVCDSSTVGNHPFLNRLLLHVRAHGHVTCAEGILLPDTNLTSLIQPSQSLI